MAWLLTSGALPSLQVVTLAGFSAGAQFLNRYAWASRTGLQAESTRASFSSRAPAAAVRFILSDASSYLYLSPLRPHASCRPLSSASTATNTSMYHTCDAFAAPSELLVAPKKTAMSSQAGDLAADGGGEMQMQEEEQEEEQEEACPAYDAWKHGIAQLPSSGYNYLSSFVASGGEVRARCDCSV